jgi:hypothetical protein
MAIAAAAFTANRYGWFFPPERLFIRGRSGMNLVLHLLHRACS